MPDGKEFSLDVDLDNILVTSIATQSGQIASMEGITPIVAILVEGFTYGRPRQILLALQKEHAVEAVEVLLAHVKAIQEE